LAWIRSLWLSFRVCPWFCRNYRDLLHHFLEVLQKPVTHWCGWGFFRRSIFGMERGQCFWSNWWKFRFWVHIGIRAWLAVGWWWFDHFEKDYLINQVRLADRGWFCFWECKFFLHYFLQRWKIGMFPNQVCIKLVLLNVWMKEFF
jgi:hypothetical protein